MYKASQFSRLMIFATVAVVGVSGCAGNDEPPLDPGFGTADRSPDTRSGGGNETNIVSDLPDVGSEVLFQSAEGMEVVFFDYNSFALRDDARAALSRNADKMKQQGGVIFQIEGHCDERGTQEYNLALGEKRALATREYLMQLGVNGDRIITISYGEEAPVALGSDESAWSKNRRCEFNRSM